MVAGIACVLGIGDGCVAWSAVHRADASGVAHRADASGVAHRADASGVAHRADASGAVHRADASGAVHRADASGDARFWPVGDRPAVVRPWSPPTTPYGPGHRGVDLAAPIGAPVRSVAAGRVSFAGEVAGRGVVSVQLTGTGDPPLRTTYEPVTASLEKGAHVDAGDPLGVLQLPTGHCPPVSPSCLHWGLVRGAVYLDPLSLLDPSVLHGAPARLLPVWGLGWDPTGAGAWGRGWGRGWAWSLQD
ncbi:murein hydrolase activator EnvC family protein [Streptomyces sp. NPDC049813]|uniref:murein hydrolase activator EnvC family protein n=1 Tax=Streptomyces sp. NPDC049813 TaxID=3365597 RepID=UPI0037B6CEED